MCTPTAASLTSKNPIMPRCGDPRCWACNIWPPKINYARKDLFFRMTIYEEMVEVVETGAPVSISELGDLFPIAGYGRRTIARSVIHDMYRHGLLVCRKKDRSPGVFKCRSWMVKKEFVDNCQHPTVWCG